MLVPAPGRLSRLAAILATPLASASRGWQQLRGAVRPGQARAEPGEVAGATLARLTVLPALAIMAWLLPGLPLLLSRSFLVVPMLLISVPLAVALTANGLRAVPTSWPGLSAGGRRHAAWTVRFGLLATVALVAGLTAWQLREASQAIVVVRDPGTYLQAGYWIAQHGSLPVPQDLPAFGGAHPGLTFASTGFYPRGDSIVPGVASGLVMMLAGGFWAHGTAGAMTIGPILGGLAALAFAGLVARLVGPQWAPAGALVLGLSLPQQYVSRSAFSETALQIMLFGGLCMLADSLALRRPPAEQYAASGVPWWRRMVSLSQWAAWLSPRRTLAALAGLALGLSLLISLDALAYLLPIIPFGCVLIAGRRPQAAPFLLGSFIGVGYGIAGGFLLYRPLLDTVGRQAALAGVAAVWLVALSIVALQLMRFAPVRGVVPKVLAERPLRWLPEAGGVIVAAVLIGFAVRPYVQTVRGSPSPAVSHFIASLQRAQGLPVDPTRLYSEQTLYWVIWYIGLPTVLLGGAGAVLLARRCLRTLITWRDRSGAWRLWGLPLAIICVGSATVLWYPDIVPDQPWASRRLVVLVLPGLVLCGLWAATWLIARARERGASVVAVSVVGLFCVAAMLVPTVATTFGLGLSHSGKAQGLRPVAQGIALQRTGVGEVSAVQGMCARIPRDASVLILDSATAGPFAQVVRGMCGVPTGLMIGQPAAAVRRVVTAISAAGRQPVLLASGPGALAGFGGGAVRVLDLVTAGDPHELRQLPTATTVDRYVVWMAVPSRPGAGA